MVKAGGQKTLSFADVMVYGKKSCVSTSCSDGTYLSDDGYCKKDTCTNKQYLLNNGRCKDCDAG